MKGDFTRWGFDSSKHFSRVLQQQGRVALDSDSNESTEILLHHLRMLTRDLFGNAGGPVDSGFTLAMVNNTSPPQLLIGPGHYYVNGILCENEDWVDYAHQADYTPAPPETNGSGGDALLAWLSQPTRIETFWAYLDVWERHVSWVEDDSIREPALGGPDTCSRAKVVWQVRALPWDTALWGEPDADGACVSPLKTLRSTGDGRLAAQVDPGPALADPCVISPAARYRGAENRLYRVEVHAGGSAGTATFKWSRENGSVATRWLGESANNEVISLVVKSSRGFSSGDWVEVSHDALELAGLPGQLLRLSVVDGDRLTIDPASIPSGGEWAWSAALLNPKVRRWDQRANDLVDLVQGAVPIEESSAADPKWIDLEDGVQVAFADDQGEYRSGDYWLIPARVATQGIDWPSIDGKAELQPPQGIVHAYAPLGMLSLDGESIQLAPCRRCLAVALVDCAVSEPVRVERTLVPAQAQVKAVRAKSRRRPD